MAPNNYSRATPALDDAREGAFELVRMTHFLASKLDAYRCGCNLCLAHRLSVAWLAGVHQKRNTGSARNRLLQELDLLGRHILTREPGNSPRGGRETQRIPRQLDRPW